MTAAMSSAAAQQHETPAHDRNGLNLSAGVSLPLGTATAGIEQGYLTSMSLGFGFLSRFDVELEMYYGELPLAVREGRPLAGVRLLGGGGIEVRYYLSWTSAWSPYLAAGFDLVSVSDPYNSGYAGFMMHAAAGIEYAVSPLFAAALEAGYRQLNFNRMMYTGTDPVQAFAPFSDGRMAHSLLIRYYPWGSESSWK